MNKKIVFALFALILVLVPVYLIYSSEAILENGHEHKLRFQGYDPLDPFRGKFIRLNYNFEVKSEKGLKEGDIAFVQLEKDSTGFSHFSFVTKNKPNHSDYIKCIVIYTFNDYATIHIENIGKYFINENKAKKAEELLTKFVNENSEDTYASIRVLDGECRLEEVYVNGKPLKEVIGN